MIKQNTSSLQEQERLFDKGMFSLYDNTMQPQPSQPISQTPPPQQLAAHEHKTSQPAFLKFLEGGLFEVIFVIFALGLILGVLNFFNVVRLGSTFPQFSFLPHLPFAKQSVATQQFSYETTQADIALGAYLKKAVTPAFLPKQASASPSADPFIYVQQANIFTSPWTVPIPNSTPSAAMGVRGVLGLFPQTNIPSYYQIVFESYHPPLALFPQMEAIQAASEEATKMFQTLPENASWKCTGAFTPTCRVSEKSSEGNYQFVVLLHQDTIATQTAILSVTSCFFPAKSQAYTKNQTCPISLSR